MEKVSAVDSNQIKSLFVVNNFIAHNQKKLHYKLQKLTAKKKMPEQLDQVLLNDQRGEINAKKELAPTKQSMV